MAPHLGEGRHVTTEVPAPPVFDPAGLQEPRPHWENETPRETSPQWLRLGTWRAGHGAVVVAAEGALDRLTAPWLGEVLGYGLRDAAHLLVVDLSRLDFLGVAGLAVLVEAHTRARQSGIVFRVVTGQNHGVSRALTVTGAHHHLSVSVGKPEFEW
jgi:anti-sigma B factor antagonist